MSVNLVEMVKNYFTGDFTNQASSVLGENASGVSKALTAIIPMGLAGILNKAISGTEGANDVYEVAKSSAENVSGTTNLTFNDNMGKGSSMISNFFGASQSGIPGAISKYAGIKESSASSLMSMALPPIMGILGKHAEQNNLSASGLAGFLASQKDQITQAMPAGLSSVAGMLGFSSLGASADTNNPTIKSPNMKSDTDEIKTISERPTAKWLVPLIVILIIIALLWYFSRSCNQTKPSPATIIDSTAMIQNTNKIFIFPVTSTSNKPELLKS